MNASSANRIKIAPGFWTSLRGIGIEPIDVARQARLPLTVISEPLVTTTQYYAIWQAYSELVGDIAAGIVKLATAYETAQYPPDALATFHACDYRDALNRMARYKQMCPPENLKIQEEGGRCSIELEWQHAELPGPPVLVGITLAYLLELGRRGTGHHLKAHAVEFINPMGDVEALESYFGCRVRTGTERNRLILNREDLDRPFTSYNEELLEILTPSLDRTLEERQSQSTMSAKVQWLLSRCLTLGRIDIQTVASELGMSERTLQRRLTEEGESFKRLLAKTKREMAFAYLANPALEIKEVAFLVGYEDQNSFYRAFRLWTGETPASWRVLQEN
ncbi:AraC-type DNA-binding protein [Paenibacillus sp. UNCCL117]|uniref:helix-turn-helix transcriptional regulator n=1 Tax=unclassified Paenibacillus TaxID=185978 RepID=UPI00088AD576|nr:MULTISPECIES: AraC family transcriptional regulator [unclassified Paenibacillus]SDE16599.1 AraC-type DNA-binding protein [Paenibacillus sp. cl123]SFW61205.1 AraC-type DNA-binding protein [Paenibacillus sp. UNCCL117]